MNTDAIWYHYFDTRDNTGSKTSYSGFLLSLTRQMGLQHEAINPTLSFLFKACGRVQKPTNKELEKVLEIIIKERNTGFLIVDAMDECAEQEPVLETLNQLPGWTLVTSRHRAPKNWVEACIDIMHKEKAQDIQTYIWESFKSRGFTEELWSEVSMALRKGAEGQ